MVVNARAAPRVWQLSGDCESAPITSWSHHPYRVTQAAEGVIGTLLQHGSDVVAGAAVRLHDNPIGVAGRRRGRPGAEELVALERDRVARNEPGYAVGSGAAGDATTGPLGILSTNRQSSSRRTQVAAGGVPTAAPSGRPITSIEIAASSPPEGEAAVVDLRVIHRSGVFPRHRRAWEAEILHRRRQGLALLVVAAYPSQDQCQWQSPRR